MRHAGSIECLVNRCFWILFLCTSIASADSTDAEGTAKTVNNTASILVVDAMWPKSASRVILKSDSPMPAATQLHDASGLVCDENDSITGSVPVKLKNGKKRMPVEFDIPLNGKISLLIAQTFTSASVDAGFINAFAMPLKTCHRILIINAEPMTTYNVEMLYDGKSCSVSISNSMNVHVPVTYTEYKDSICRNGKILNY